MLAPHSPRFPRLIRFVLGNVLTGAIIGWTVAVFAVMADFMGVGSLLLDSPDWMAGSVMLAFASGAGFGLGYLATALLLIEAD